MPYSSQEKKTAHQRKWVAKDPARTKANNRATHLKRVYGITTEQYDELLQRQNGCCGICRRAADTFKTNLCVDHDHHSGDVRGLLCTHCNRRIVGRLRGAEGSLLLRYASEYLNPPYTGWLVPPKRKKKRKSRGKNPSNRTR